MEAFFSFWLFDLIAVDEYILMAKEKHGYNMEQVWCTPECYW